MKLKIALSILALSVSPLGFAKDNDRFARIILFIPSDAEAPKNFEARLASLAVRSEALLSENFERWKHPVERSEIFARNDNGTMKVTLVKSDLLNPKGRGALPEVREKAISGAKKQLALKPGGPPVIWWIFYDYPEVKGFQGGARGSGGIAINAYPKGDDLIRVKTELAGGDLAEMAIKGTIHEFGHALGLPHIGPRPGLKLGNSLMGPINRAFWRKSGTTDVRVYINEASIVALWKHPVFRKEASPNPRMPARFSVGNLDITESRNGKTTVIKGELSAGNSAHSVIVLDSERGTFGDYWARSYASAVDPDTGGFEVSITEPFETGTLFLGFAFENGMNTSDGKRPFQQGSSVEISYVTKGGRRIFKK